MTDFVSGFTVPPQEIAPGPDLQSLLQQGLQPKPVSAEPGPIGLSPQMRVLTTDGPCPMRHLRPGQRVQTRDHGILPILWAGPVGMAQSVVHLASGSVSLHDTLTLAPAQTLLCHVPEHLGCTEALVQARGLLRQSGVSRRSALGQPFYHLMLPKHALFMVAGLWIDSLHPDAIRAQHPQAPHIHAIARPGTYGPPVLPTLSRQAARRLPLA